LRKCKTPPYFEKCSVVFTSDTSSTKVSVKKEPEPEKSNQLNWLSNAALAEIFSTTALGTARQNDRLWSYNNVGKRSLQAKLIICY
jgi:hypothetical protein